MHSAELAKNMTPPPPPSKKKQTMTIKEELHEINEEMAKLRARRRELETEERKDFLQEATKNIGRCFYLGNNEYAVVTGVPKVEQTMEGVSFNRYQYPAIYLTEDDVPFYEDTIFSGYWGVGDLPPFARRKHYEITPEEFLHVFEKKVVSIRDLLRDAISTRNEE